jgi:hypothetical protein
MSGSSGALRIELKAGIAAVTCLTIDGDLKLICLIPAIPSEIYPGERPEEEKKRREEKKK